MGFLRRKPKPPTPRDLARAERTGHIEATEAERETGMVDGVAFDYQVIESETILALIHPNSPYRLDWLEEIIPLVDRLNFLTNCSEDEARSFKDDVDCALTRLKFTRENGDEQRFLDNLKTYFYMRINDSVHGFKLNALAERKRTIRIQEEEIKKRRFFR